MRHSSEFAIGVQVYRAAIVESYRDVQLSNHPFQSQKKAQSLSVGWTQWGGETHENHHEMSGLPWVGGGSGGEGLRRDGLFGVLAPIRL